MVEYGSAGPFSYRKVYFTDPRPRDSWGLTQVYHAPSRPRGFLAQKAYTFHVGLDREPEQIFQAFRSTWRRHIRQAEALAPVYEISYSKDEFKPFFDHFAELKGIARYDRRENLLFTRMMLDGRPVTYHAYTVDREVGIVRLRHSGSVRLDDGAATDQIASINKAHHWKDMLYLKEQGLKTYDFGGCQPHAEGEQKTLFFFKEGFGGTMVQEWHGLSVPLAVLFGFLKVARLGRSS